MPTAAVLYWLQHNGVLSGGAIAPSKLAWLFSVIVFWFILPVYFLFDKSPKDRAKKALCVFLVSMLLRAVIELSMMYITNNWLHVYGISHNLFSIFLCVVFFVLLFHTDKLVSLFFACCACLFLIETYFAQYLRTVSGANGKVFFLEVSAEHSQVLVLTRIAVGISVVMFFILVSKRAAGDTTKR